MGQGRIKAWRPKANRPLREHGPRQPVGKEMSETHQNRRRSFILHVQISHQAAPANEAERGANLLRGGISEIGAPHNLGSKLNSTHVHGSRDT